VCYEETPLGSTWKAWPMNATFDNVTWVPGPRFSGEFNGPPLQGVTLSHDWSLCQA